MYFNVINNVADPAKWHLRHSKVKNPNPNSDPHSRVQVSVEWTPALVKARRTAFGPRCGRTRAGATVLDEYHRRVQC